MNTCLPTVTVLAWVNAGMVVLGVFHLASQSSSEVTSNQAPTPLTDFWEAVSGTGLPWLSFQKNVWARAGAAVARNIRARSGLAEQRNITVFRRRPCRSSKNRWGYRASSQFCVHSFLRAVVRDRRRRRNFLASLLSYDEWSCAAFQQFWR